MDSDNPKNFVDALGDLARRGCVVKFQPVVGDYGVVFLFVWVHHPALALPYARKFHAVLEWDKVAEFLIGIGATIPFVRPLPPRPAHDDDVPRALHPN